MQNHAAAAAAAIIRFDDGNPSFTQSKIIIKLVTSSSTEPIHTLLLLLQRVDGLRLKRSMRDSAITPSAVYTGYLLLADNQALCTNNGSIRHTAVLFGSIEHLFNPRSLARRCASTNTKTINKFQCSMIREFLALSPPVSTLRQIVRMYLSCCLDRAD